MFTATLWCDLRLDGPDLPPVRSLKGKRSVLKPILAQLRREYAVSAAEVGAHDLLGRAELGVAVVAGTAAQVGSVLDRCEADLAQRPEVVVLATHRQLLSHTDDPGGG